MLREIGLFLFFIQYASSMYLGQNWGNVLGSERIEQPRCVSIPQNFSLCHGIQYDLMRLPNLLDHESLDEAIQQSDAWNSLLRLHCHADTKLFLCSVFAPVCVQEMDKPIYPCQSLCRAVQQGCENRMLQYGFAWPESLDCSKYPADNDMCIKRPAEEAQQGESSNGQPHSRMFPSIQQQVGLTSTVLPQTTHFNLNRTTKVVKSSQSDLLQPTVSFVSSTTNTPIIQSVNAIHVRKCRLTKTFLTTFVVPIRAMIKAKVRQHNATHLVIQKVQRVFKPATNGRRPANQVGQLVQISEDSDCQCPTSGKDRMAGNYLIMSQNANQAETRPINARLLLPWLKHKVFKSAVRKFRKVNCGTLGREIRESVLRQTQRHQLQF
ncbi:Fz domain protein [Aphelenchoides bicaudatus]|nr:Fz domain protein [Aphelenchoides bicaudatus]